MQKISKVWNLKDILPAHKGEEFERIASLLNDKVSAFENERKQLTKDMPSADFNAKIKALAEIKEILAKIEAYGHLWFTEDASSQEARAFLAKAEELSADIENRTLFFELWWRELDEKNAQRLLKESGKNLYFLEHIRKLKEYYLSEESEKLINLKSVTGINAVVKLYEIVTSSFRFTLEADGEKKELSQSELSVFVRDKRKEVREKAYESLLGVYSKHQDVLGEIYSTVIRDLWNEKVKLRKYTSPISIRNKANDIPDEAVDTLLQTCRENSHLFARYFKAKAESLGLKKMSRYHIYAPVGGEESKYKYEDAVKLVLETFSSYSEKIGVLAKRLFDKQHVHSALGKNKHSGAYCLSITPKEVPYVLLNYTERMRDVMTLAHELGHAVHSQLASEQTIFTFHSVLPLAETASVFGEMMVTQRLLENERAPELRKHLIASKLDDIYATVIRQAFFTLFEIEAHNLIQKGATLKELSDAYYKNLKEQFNDTEVPQIFSFEWSYIPHIFKTPFYCYAYSFGNLLTLALYKMYQEQGKDFIPKYIKLLSAGKSASPEQLLSELGINIRSKEFWQKGFDVIKEMVEEFERLCA